MLNPDDMIPAAVEFCIKETPGCGTAEEVVAALKSGDPFLNSRLRQALARDAAGYLSELFGSRIKAARLYGSAAEYSACVYSDIDIVILVAELPENLRQVIADLDRILSRSYCRLLGKDEDEWSYLLDVHIINEDPRESRQPSMAYLEHIFMNGSIAVG